MYVCRRYKNIQKVCGLTDFSPWRNDAWVQCDLFRIPNHSIPGFRHLLGEEVVRRDALR